MPQTPHVERHFTASDSVRDVVIGMSDGLTVPFALAAGLSGAVGSTGLVVVAGLAEIAAGGIAMGLGGYLAARSDAEHYTIERARFIPLAPYIALARVPVALTVSVTVTVAALGLFGWIKGHLTGTAPLRSAFQTMLIGGGRRGRGLRD